MLGNFLKTALDEIMPKLMMFYDRKDYVNFQNAAHTLKGSSGYVAASRLHYQCYFIQVAFQDNDMQGMMDMYQGLVESAIELKIYSKRMIAENSSQVYEFNKNEVHVVHSESFITVAHSDGFLYCCKKSGQTVK